MKGSRTDVVVAGHICLDIIPTLGERKSAVEALLAPGKLVQVGPAVTATGGAVSNTGLALHRLGVPTRLMGKVGDDVLGRAILDLLRAYGSALADGVIAARGEHSSYTIVISPPGVDRIFLHCPGANDTFGADDVAYDELRGARLFHFGYPPVMRRMYADGGKELERLFHRVKEQGLTISLDMAMPDPESEAGRVPWPSFLERVLPYVDVFLPNWEECLFMVDRERFDQMQQTGPQDEASRIDPSLLEDLSQRLLELGGTVVGLKLGDQGLYLRTTAEAERLTAAGDCAPRTPELWAKRELLAPCFQVDVVGTTGAGDCTIAGFLAGLLHGLPPEDTITAAVAVGACNVEKADATSGVPSWSVVQQRIRSGWKRRPLALSLPGWQWDEQKAAWIGPNDATVQ